jgi:hypothetical protein
MKFIEQQLVVSLTETPPETECTLSAAVLKGIGLVEQDAQLRWLDKHRPARDGKSWHYVDERWEYAAEAPSVGRTAPISIPGANWRTSLTPERLLKPIVVKPLQPVAKTSKLSRGPAAQR